MQPHGIVISLLGDPAWTRPGDPPVKLSAKDAALIARLALDGPQSRGALCELLWPFSDGRQSEASLRQRASRLHRASGQRIVEVGAQVRLGEGIHVDVLALDAFDDEQLLGAGTLLAGHDLGDHDELDHWLLRARERAVAALVRTLTDRAESHEAAGRLRAALPLAARAVELAPLNEHAWRRLMRLHYLRDDLAAARDAGLRLTAVLRDELGARPSAESLQLMQTVEAAEHDAPPKRRPVPASLLRPPVLVGRGALWHAMSAAWQQPGAFLVVGDAGQGKSRLLEEFVRGQQGLVMERAQPGDEASPYAVLGRLLLSVQRRFEPTLTQAQQRELARIRAEFGVPAASAAAAAVLWHAVEAALAQSVPRGLSALVIDDLHNADAATLEALCWLQARPALAALRLGLATRPMPEGPAAQAVSNWLAASHHPVRLVLEPLDPGELAALLASLGLPSLVDRDVVDRLYRHAGGHLLFTLATLQDAVVHDAGLLADELPRPGSIQVLLDQRLRALPAQTQDLMRIAAVAGSDFSAERAARLLDRPLLSLLDDWAALEAADVLRGESFSHDLVHESALRSVPAGLRAALHRRLAGLLEGDAAASPSRVAWHWEQGGRWGAAARWWQAAGERARVAGRLDEQIEFHERAAGLYRRAGDGGACFESLMARLEGLRLRSGGGAVLACLPELEAQASTSVQRLRCLLAKSLALLDRGEAEPAAEAAALAWHEAEFHPAWRAEAGVMQAQALAQCGRFDESIAAGREALAASALGQARHRIAALNALSFAHYATGRLADAVRWQRDAIAEAERQGDHATAVIGEGNLAALLASVGNVPATHAQALRARERYAAIRVGDNSSFDIVNHLVLGAAAAALGRFDEALDSLEAAVASAGEQAAPAGRAKARLALAQLWLTLGRAEAAFEQLDALPQELIPGMAIQAALLRTRAAAQRGLPTGRHLDALARLAQGHRQLPLVQSAWFEVSYIGEAHEVIEDLRRVGAQCRADGLAGTARSLQWRELVRWLELDGDEAATRALAIAEALAPHADAGLSAKCYPPEVWCTLADAFARTGNTQRQADALASARRWIEAALPRVAEPWRAGFLQRNPINRRVMASGPPYAGH